MVLASILNPDYMISNFEMISGGNWPDLKKKCSHLFKSAPNFNACKIKSRLLLPFLLKLFPLKIKAGPFGINANITVRCT